MRTQAYIACIHFLNSFKNVTRSFDWYYSYYSLFENLEKAITQMTALSHSERRLTSNTHDMFYEKPSIKEYTIYTYNTKTGFTYRILKKWAILF